MSRKLVGRKVVLGLALVVGFAFCACGNAQEATRVRLPVSVSRSGITPVTTDLGYRVELLEARMMLSDVVFAIAGEAHSSSFWELPSSWLLGTAHAHPGHYQGGEVTGELRGRFCVDWLADERDVNDGQALYDQNCSECHGTEGQGSDGRPAIGGHPRIAEFVTSGPGEMPAFEFSDAEVRALQAYLSQQLGQATLLEGLYHSADFRFATADDNDGLPASDPLLGNTAVLRGTASKDSETLDFLAVVTSDENRLLVGAPFESKVTKATHERLELRLLTQDPVEPETLFDGIDFASLDADQDGTVVIAERGSTPSDGNTDAGTSQEESLANAYNLLKRTFQTHDHFDIHSVAPSK